MPIDDSDEKFVARMVRLGLKHWWKILIVLVVAGALLTSCEIPTPWGPLKKGGLELPWGK